MVSAAIWSVPIAWGLAALPLVGRVVLSLVHGNFDNCRPRDRAAQVQKMPPNRRDMADRLLAAHNNQLETLGYYAAAVAVAVAVRVPEATLVPLTSLFLKARLAYVCAYTAPQVANGALRSISFAVAMASIARIYVAAAHAASVSV